MASKKMYRGDPWGSPDKAALGGYNSSHDKIVSRPDWLDMIPVKRYKHFTRFMKLCPNGEVYYECFNNDDVDKEKKKRGLT